MVSAEDLRDDHAQTAAVSTDTAIDCFNEHLLACSDRALP